jgi:hypothetical protein
VSFNIVMKLSGAHDYSITYLLHFRVILIGVDESFGNKIYWYLLRWFSTFFAYFPFLHEGGDI